MPKEPPYGPGAICEDCGHFAMRHGPAVRQGKHRRLPGCNNSDLVVGGYSKGPCRCRGMLWQGVRWPSPSERQVMSGAVTLREQVVEAIRDPILLYLDRKFGMIATVESDELAALLADKVVERLAVPDGE